MKRSITLAGRKTSVTLEDEFWQGMRLIAHNENTTLISLVSRIDCARSKGNNLSSAIRVFVLNYFRLRFRRVAVGLVQHGAHVPRLDTDHRQIRSA